eukprot:CAMPEP_0201576440 /NCGR_PEP_ID=MMETSP0190_2-20130828/22289_1 /ASSEMBLY_ACC=CAM_ASM_000263 /TAXON_ID=37353 /ORGANISM="Rosalina sp." /LENGTH=198 /DNA_ID=CAMNT_0048007325 /DNA_START=44 /DNA_END=637 /DNA_ORIENTATION=+
MLKTIIFLTIIVKLAFGEEIEAEYEEDELSMTMDVFEALATCEIDETDELNEIEAEVQKRCLEIKKRGLCLRATSPVYPDGVLLKRKPNLGNDAQGECVYIPSKRNIVARKLGNQCVSPASVKKLLRRLKRNGVPPEESIMAKSGVLSANEGTQFDVNYMIATVVIIGLLISFGAYYKYKGNAKESSNLSSEKKSLYQ